MPRGGVGADGCDAVKNDELVAFKFWVGDWVGSVRLNDGNGEGDCEEVRSMAIEIAGTGERACGDLRIGPSSSTLIVRMSYSFIVCM